MTFIVSHQRLLWILVGACIVTFLWLLQFRKRLQMTWWAALILSVVHVFFGVFCVMLFARLEGANSGAMSIFGAVFFMPIGYYLGAKLFRRSLSDVFDVFSVPMIFTLFCSRINCLAAGCCYGLPIGDSGLQWPTREAEMIFYLVFLVIYAPRIYKNQAKGEVYPLYMIFYGIVRAVIECFRYSSATSSVFHLSHVWAALSVLIGLTVFLELKERRNPKRKNRRS